MFIAANNLIFSQVPQSVLHKVIVPINASDPTTPNGYSPSLLTIQVGQSVNWTNNDNVFHTVTAISQAFDSGIMEPGDYFVWTFDDPGFNKYYCQIHPYMNGAINID